MGLPQELRLPKGAKALLVLLLLVSVLSVWILINWQWTVGLGYLAIAMFSIIGIAFFEVIFGRKFGS